MSPPLIHQCHPPSPQGPVLDNRLVVCRSTEWRARSMMSNRTRARRIQCEVDPCNVLTRCMPKNGLRRIGSQQRIKQWSISCPPWDDDRNAYSSHRNLRRARFIAPPLHSEGGMVRQTSTLTPWPVRLAGHRQHSRYAQVARMEDLRRMENNLGSVAPSLS